MLTYRSLILPVLPLLLASCAAASRPAPAPAPARSGPELVVLVRHAETAPDGTRDPALSAPGLARAERLRVLLGEVGFDAVHSTALQRTLSTASPLADALGLDVTAYDPFDLSAFAARLRVMEGRHLVVGHSNTTPELVELLGGDPGAPIAEDEHDRVYLLLPEADGMRTVVLRY